MNSEWNQVGFFAAGLAIGAVAVAMIVLGPYAPARSKPQARLAVAQAAPVALAPACPQEPVATVAGIKDGRYRMPADLSGYASTDPQVFMVMASEAVAAGRVHDAEIAYLMACRVADQYRGAGSTAAVEARYELARHYGNLAKTSGATAPNCGELLQRAEALYSDSLRLFRAQPGSPPEKVRLAEQGLAGVRQLSMAQAGVTAATAPAATALQPPPEPSAVADPPQGAPAPEAATIARPQPPVARARTLVPPRPSQAKPSAEKKVAARSRATPSCAGARTRAERLICSDAELARIDREVGYLQARARNAWRHEGEWRRLEATCQDRSCLLRVFATKRSQLMADINSA